MGSPEEHVEEESVEIESEENPLGQMEELTPKLMLVRIPGTDVPQPSLFLYFFRAYQKDIYSVKSEANKNLLLTVKRRKTCF